MTTAQERFRATVRDRIAPALREMGMRGSGQTYALASDTHWAMLGFQRNKWSDRDRVTFTVNLSVVSRSAWEHAREREPWMAARPTANERWPVKYQLDERLGDLCGRGDYWWRLSVDGSDEDSTVGDLLRVIEGYALPALQRAISEGDTTSPVSASDGLASPTSS